MLLSFTGVGPKCANLALGIACGLPLIGVDVHVHRVTNRWGYVAGEDAGEDDGGAAGEAAAARYWVEINALLVPFGKHVCTGDAAEVLDVPAAGDVPAGRGDAASLRRSRPPPSTAASQPQAHPLAPGIHNTDP